MTTIEIAFTVVAAILWLNVGISSTRDFNDIDNDATDWVTFPLLLKIITILLAPIMMPIFDRHIFETKKKK